MDSGTQINIPPEAYAALGVFITANLGVIIAFIKSMMGNAAEKALTQKAIIDTNIAIGEIKAKLEKNQTDTNEAHARIREMNAKWQSRNTGV